MLELRRKSINHLRPIGSIAFWNEDFSNEFVLYDHYSNGIEHAEIWIPLLKESQLPVWRRKVNDK